MKRITRSSSSQKESSPELPPGKKRRILGSAHLPNVTGESESPHGAQPSLQVLPTPPDSRSESAETQTIENATGRPQRAAKLRCQSQFKFLGDQIDGESDNESSISEQYEEDTEADYVEDEASGEEAESEHSEEEEAEADHEEESEVEELAIAEPSKARPRTTRPPNDSKRGLDPNLPPLSDIQDIFTDLTQKALDSGLGKALEVLAGTKLRIATMCSGTESPLLALQLASTALEKLGQKPLQLEHVFSAEIVPRKQAYIERNFKPPIIFRDVREFSREDAMETGATNVYGAKVPIPGDVDLLVAGSSCVDFSMLNTKKGKVAKGESQETLKAILDYVSKWKPTLLIFENVSGAPWKELKAYAGGYGYQADFVKVDTKDFYLPQTRMRGYMLWIRQDRSKNNSKALKQWCELMKKSFRRRASAPASAFLLPGDDPRVHQFNSELSRIYQNWVRSRIVEWNACRRRHENVRSEEQLGEKKPITQWVKGGTCVTYDHAHKLWLLKMPERVWDSIDIRFLRAAIKGFDPNFKTMIMELSQNVDRGGETAFGICSCITPSGIFYLTDRAAPMTPHETLALQGIPLDKISLTVESMTEVQDLAGNAMSSTVVGAAQLAALIVAWPSLKRSGKRCAQLSATKSKARSSFVGQELLKVSHNDQDYRPLAPDFDVSRLCIEAIQSRRGCYCEGTWETARTSILVCNDCGHRACSACASKPEHNYRLNDSTSLAPQKFSADWKRHLPIALQLIDLPEIQHLEASMLHYVSEHSLGDLDKQLLGDYCDAVDSIRNEKLTFRYLKRTSYVPWVARYASSKAIAELEIGTTAEWKLYVTPSKLLVSNGTTRKILERPVARAKLSSDRWTADWEWLLPSLQTYAIQIKGSEEKKPAWRAEYGLIEHRNETLPSSLEIGPATGQTGDVSGTYRHLPKCGTACSSLYRRDGATSLYLFLDPTRVGPINEDCFVFSSNPERLDYGEPREKIAALASTFRPWDPESFSTTVTPAVWMKDTATTVAPVDVKRIIKRLYPCSDEPSIASKCSDVLAILNVECHHHGMQSGVYRAVESDMGDFFSKFSWMLENGAELSHLTSWMPLSNNLDGACTQCSPQPPPLRWRPEEESNRGGNNKVQLVSHQDPHLSAEFERGLKTRPSILEADVNVDPISGACSILIGVNPISLAHRAWGLLKKDRATLSWNLDSSWTPYGVGDFPAFSLKNNKKDIEHAQPAGFRLQLKPSQLRSLTWMRSQEMGIAFTLEEVEEEVIAPLHWKIEGRAQADITVKGGVVADQVSFGKTVTSLALIHQGFLETQAPPDDDGSGLIHLKATLVVVPAQLPDQWFAQIQKCLDNSFYGKKDVLVIKSLKDLLSTEIKDFQAAKVVIVSFALFESDSYMKQFENITAMPVCPTKEGRAFMEWFKYATDRIPGMNSMLKKLGKQAFQSYLKQEATRTEAHEDFHGRAPSKRTKGAKYKGFEPTEQENRAQKAENASTTYKTPACSGDWDQSQFPVLHQFRFNRLIVDEFTYPMEMRRTSRKNQILLHTHLTTLSADKRWILSGTPPLSDFADVKRIASYLNVNLGIDCDAPGVISQENAKALRKEQTDFEIFLSFRIKRSAAWHVRRHALAQEFLNRFARQNVAELGHIKCSISLHPIRLRPHHMAAYQELCAQLGTTDNDVKSAVPDKNDEGHRFEQIRQSLQGQDFAEVALMTRAASDRVDSTGSPTACLSVMATRHAEMRAWDVKMEKLIGVAKKLRRRFPDQAKEFNNWAAKYLVDSPIVCDKDSHSFIRKAIEQQGPTGVVDKGVTLKKFVRNTLTAEERRYVDARRSLRSSRAVGRIVESARQEVNVECKCCDTHPPHEVAAQDSAVIIGCGHLVCRQCLELVLSTRKCQVNGCDMDVDSSGVLHGDHICSLEDLPSEETSFGAKLDEIVDLIEDRSKIKDDEQVIIFVQSQDMVDIMGAALKSRHVPFHAISRAEERASKTIQDFVKHQRYSNGRLNKHFKRVLILNQTDESAAGTDLFNANHVIFVSPLFETTAGAYQAKMDQAIGRARRLGQKKQVHVHRFFVMHTGDVDLLEQMERRYDGLVEGPELPLLWEPENTTEKEQCRVVKLSDGKMALLPQSWVFNEQKARDAGFDLGVSAEAAEEA
ncbi:hypothetical protein IWX90DRAFT_409460 [Phyllosticta citrichinensis]|uniref:Helicase C-terminal domain-containing protein n=1 Tax=Phyllosticta citrichinensis TaxID=1130410 RepID=A0ABR1XFX2_9PEZI